MKLRFRLRIFLGAIRQRTIPGLVAFLLTGGKVSSGPFVGMDYILTSIGSALGPKLLGTYEAELHPIIDRLLRRRFDHVVDVGAAEGYYAVGFARALPGASVVAFEQEKKGRDLLQKLACANGVEEMIAIRGRCEPVDLQEALRPGSLLVTDVEGYERILLDPERVPGLRHATILSEVHAPDDGLGGEICQRFAATHDAHWIKPQPRPLPGPRAGGHGWLSRYLQWEHRSGPFYWIFLDPRALEHE